MAVKHLAEMKEYLKDCEVYDEPWKLWECRHVEVEDGWQPLNGHPTWQPTALYRRKPKTITINGIEVPAPLAHKPGKGTRYYTFGSGGNTFGVCWDDDESDNDRFTFGIWGTQEDAEQVTNTIKRALKP